ncbi:hypothetical protein GYM75_09935 [Gilliamella sp. ESL0441]|uniref:hypothetical protein n=1 Tax=Gilliamella sp. ESL0441 TaxID=2704654 RepID=UPI001C69676D|nr:hypothetical protein [Gilliamella sp. ESL0441]QYN45141.1 hypothetical protein GYM75_09935 [Gilliamella sp. ESL0441]
MPKQTNYTIRRTELSQTLYDAIISEVANHHQFNNFDISTLTINFDCIKEYKINNIDKIIDRLERYLKNHPNKIIGSQAQLSKILKVKRSTISRWISLELISNEKFNYYQLEHILEQLRLYKKNN